MYGIIVFGQSLVFSGGGEGRVFSCESWSGITLGSLGERNGAQLAVSTARNAAHVHRVPGPRGLSVETSGLGAAEEDAQRSPMSSSGGHGTFHLERSVETGNKGQASSWGLARDKPGTEALRRNGAKESLGTRETVPPCRRRVGVPKGPHAGSTTRWPLFRDLPPSKEPHVLPRLRTLDHHHGPRPAP